jgi:hypothetical protein
MPEKWCFYYRKTMAGEPSPKGLARAAGGGDRG